MATNTPPDEDKRDQERRSPDRTRDDADWETKVLGRVRSRVRKLTDEGKSATGGWESEVVDRLRRKIDRDSK